MKILGSIRSEVLLVRDEKRRRQKHCAGAGRPGLFLRRARHAARLQEAELTCAPIAWRRRSFAGALGGPSAARHLYTPVGRRASRATAHQFRHTENDMRSSGLELLSEDQATASFVSPFSIARGSCALVPASRVAGSGCGGCDGGRLAPGYCALVGRVLVSG